MLRRALIAVCLALACAALPTAAASADIVVDYGDSGWSYKAVPTGSGSLTPDATWTTGGTTPFGSLSSCASGLPAPTTNGGWTNNGDLLLSKTFTLPPGAGGGSVSVRVDNDVAVSVNGQPLASAEHEGCANVSPPGAMAIPAAQLHAGANVVALRAHDDADQRYIDAQVQVDIPDGFTVGIAPAAITAGTAADVQATITNWSPGTLDAVTLDPPDGLGDPVALTGLGLAPGASLTRSIPRTAACGPDGGAWGASAPGLQLLGDAGSTAVTGDCSIAFGAPPASAETGQTITAAAGTPVTVQVRDGNGALAANGTAVTLAIVPGSPYLGTLHGTTTQTTSGGTATFADLSIDKSGSYQLTAGAAGAGSATSDAFLITDAETTCTNDATCEASVSSPTTQIQGTGVSNGVGVSSISLSLNAGSTFKCKGYTPFSPDWVDVNGSANLLYKLITFKISYRTLVSGWQTNGLSRVQACFSAPYTFAPRAGYERVAAPYDGDGDGVPETWYTGVLPECKVLFTTKPPPCVSERKLLRDGIAVTVKMPGGAIDPRMRG